MTKHWLYKILDFFYTLFFHRRIIRLQSEELAKSFEARINEMIVRHNEVKITIESDIVRIWTAMFVGLLKSYPDAKNYLSMPFRDVDSQIWELMLQRVEGKSPTEIVIEQREAIVELNRKISELEAELKLVNHE